MQKGRAPHSGSVLPPNAAMVKNPYRQLLCFSSQGMAPSFARSIMPWDSPNALPAGFFTCSVQGGCDAAAARDADSRMPQSMNTMKDVGADEKNLYSPTKTDGLRIIAVVRRTSIRPQSLHISFPYNSLAPRCRWSRCSHKHLRKSPHVCPYRLCAAGPGRGIRRSPF